MQVKLVPFLLAISFNTHPQDLALVKQPPVASMVTPSKFSFDASNAAKTAFKYGAFFAAPAWASYKMVGEIGGQRMQTLRALHDNNNNITITKSSLWGGATPFAISAVAALYGGYAHGWKWGLGYGALAALLHSPALLYARTCMANEQRFLNQRKTAAELTKKDEESAKQYLQRVINFAKKDMNNQNILSLPVYTKLDDHNLLTNAKTLKNAIKQDEAFNKLASELKKNIDSRYEECLKIYRQGTNDFLLKPEIDKGGDLKNIFEKEIEDISNKIKQASALGEIKQYFDETSYQNTYFIITYPLNKDLMTLLHLAALYKNFDAIEILTKNADSSAWFVKSRQGITPLYYFATILESSNATDEQKEYVLKKLSSLNNIKAVNELIKKLAENEKNETIKAILQNNSPSDWLEALPIAFQNNNFELFKYLPDNLKNDPNLLNEDLLKIIEDKAKYNAKRIMQTEELYKTIKTAAQQEKDKAINNGPATKTLNAINHAATTNAPRTITVRKENI